MTWHVAVLLVPGDDPSSWVGEAATELRVELVRRNIEVVATSPHRILARGVLNAPTAEEAEAIMAEVLTGVPKLEPHHISSVQARRAQPRDRERWSTPPAKVRRPTR